ncbi:hypothetical protein TSUD_398810 [Trifolium subterraneum]|uniref:Uncharacterized protein n=1 Tax=Trifolium subterraneum TaxID=3900 RepID=A0A2Z6NHK1_TRISU|nr:hypothetical protein TSUD_398810 [Trifolium subterraneum]
MTTLFHDMMHKEIEVYVDDMIVKSGTEEEHVEYLSKMFQRLRKYRLRLNPNKCTFGIRSGKLLGFIVSQKGIEVDPDKVRAIGEMPAPQTENQVRGFLGRLNYISRFISHMTATCGPIFKLLRKNQGIVWTEDCQKAFDSIKEYLMELPILIPPVEGRPLIIKKFTDCESRYSMLEKTCCALAWAAKRLRHYLINHTTWLISKMDPIKYIFEKAALTGRIARWQMLLSKYDIEYRTQKAIKGSILADHLAHQPVEDYQPIKFDFPDEEIMYLKMKDCDEPVFGEGPDPESKWGLIFDGAVNLYGSRIGAIIVTPKGAHIPFTARLQFEYTNNIAEYEACIMGIEEAIDLRIKNIDIYGDSALVINQIKGEWETHHAGLIPYRDYARRLLTFFNKVELHHIPRDENQMADALATLSSMTNLNNKMMKDLCGEFKIEHHNSSPYRPQMNGAVEAANKNIKKIVQKMVVTYKDWHEMLAFALHGYRTSVRTLTGAIPFFLVYGMEAVLPVEVEIPSMRVLMENELAEAEWCQNRYDQLNLIEEKRMVALFHGQLYQRRMKQAFDRKPDSRGKWTPNYEGPYVVKRVFSGGAMTLATMDGDELPRPVNADAVKKYFV